MLSLTLSVSSSAPVLSRENLLASTFAARVTTDGGTVEDQAELEKALRDIL
jgi:hypothetical protein|tara:strand:+ start:3673 stop:3825 length:153 start_codon:yes stop_codon:yes gene_type:complete